MDYKFLNLHLAAIVVVLATLILLKSLDPFKGDSGGAVLIRETTSLEGCIIQVKVPPYGQGASDEKPVVISWDKRVVFRGIIPTVELISIDAYNIVLDIICDPGTHLLEFKHGSDEVRVELNLDPNEIKVYSLFDGDNRKIMSVKETASIKGTPERLFDQ